MTQSAAFTRRVDRLCGGRSPSDGFLAERYAVGQGWNHAYLADTLQRARPSVVLALGGWKGGFTIHMAETMLPMRSGGIVIAVDPRLCSWGHWENPAQYQDLLSVFGYPTMSITFLANTVAHGLQGRVLPLPLSSGNACFMADRRGFGRM